MFMFNRIRNDIVQYRKVFCNENNDKKNQLNSRFFIFFSFLFIFYSPGINCRKSLTFKHKYMYFFTVVLFCRINIIIIFKFENFCKILISF